MDGDLKTAPPAEPIAPPRSDIDRPATARPKTVRWFIIVAVLIALVLGGLYEFNRFRSQAITSFFAHNKPPAAEISAVVAKTEIVPRSAPAIGSLDAVQQVTISPEVSGRVTQILFKSGAEVKTGDKLVQFNDAPDQGDLLNYQAQARWQAISLKRAQTLAKSQYAAQETVDQTQSLLDEARAEIQKTEAIIAQKLIRAPFAGRLGVRQINLGQYLNAGAPIVTLTNLAELYVNFTLPSRDRAEIKVGQRVTVTADAFSGRKFTATITTIEPQISPQTRTITVQARMANPEEALLPGMFVNADVELPPGPPEVVLPQTAVDYTLYGDSVYVIREAGKDAQGKPILKAVRVPVTTGTQWDGNVAILKGVKPGEQVVAVGQNKVQSGGQVIVTGNPPPAPPKHPTLE
ncbi:MAG TPA: efflux RND transporter periplasmic adaptor subunit [Stellaceae bacterium]|nr:efflux RND transporter periplasmic adaptor subunit [Stellaceae bacterium]